MLTDVIVKSNWKSINDSMFIQYCAWMELIENIIEFVVFYFICYTSIIGQIDKDEERKKYMRLHALNFHISKSDTFFIRTCS